MAEPEVITIKLNGKDETLRPTLKAAKIISRAGGFRQVNSRLQDGDLDTYFLVTAAGLDKKPDDVIDKSTKMTVEKAVFEAGLPALAVKLVRFTNLLANGGKPFKPQKLKTVEFDGKAYAELNESGEPLYVDDPDAEPEPAGEG